MIRESVILILPAYKYKYNQSLLIYIKKTDISNLVVAKPIGKLRDIYWNSAEELFIRSMTLLLIKLGKIIAMFVF